MRIVAATLLVLCVGAGAAPHAWAAPSNSCKQCSEDRRACLSGYSGKTCQIAYERCMKSCKQK